MMTLKACCLSLSDFLQLIQHILVLLIFTYPPHFMGTRLIHPGVIENKSVFERFLYRH